MKKPCKYLSQIRDFKVFGSHYLQSSEPSSSILDLFIPSVMLISKSNSQAIEGCRFVHKIVVVVAWDKQFISLGFIVSIFFIIYQFRPTVFASIFSISTFNSNI